MNVEVLIENIEKYLSTLSRVLPTHTQVPILSNVLLSATNDGFFIKATDLELGISIKIPAKVNTEGEITIPGKQFIETITNLPKDKVIFSIDGENLNITSRESKISFQTLPAAEFPALMKTKGEKVLSVEKSQFDNIFSHLSFSASTDEVRPQLTGVYIAKKDQGVDFVTTDGYRMTLKNIENVDFSKISEPIIISIQVINEVMQVKDNTVDMYVNTDENQIVFEVGEVILVGRLIDGKFPPYERVVPASEKTVVVANRDELMQNIRLASVFAKAESNIVNFEIEDGRIVITTKTAGVGKGEFVVECEKEGEDNRVALNVRYLLDALKNLEGERVTLKLNSAVEPALFIDQKNTLKHIIMPIKTD